MITNINIIGLGLSLPPMKEPGPCLDVCFHSPGLLGLPSFLYPLHFSFFIPYSISFASRTLAPSFPAVLILLPIPPSLFVFKCLLLVIEILSY